MTQDFIDEMEETFFSKHFEFGEDADTVRENLTKAEHLLTVYRPKVEELAEAIEDGLVFDVSDAVLTLQIFSFSAKYRKYFAELLNQ